MTIGPVEYVIIGFPDDDAIAHITPALAQLESSGTVHILDLIFVTLGADGALVVREFDELDGAADLDAIDGEVDGILSEDDAALVAATLEPGGSAVLIVWEDRWATALAEDVRAAGGQIIAGERIPHGLVVEALAELGA